MSESVRVVWAIPAPALVERRTRWFAMSKVLRAEEKSAISNYELLEEKRKD